MKGSITGADAQQNELVFEFPELDAALARNDNYVLPLRRRLEEIEPYLLYEEQIRKTYGGEASGIIISLVERFLPSALFVEDPSAPDVSAAFTVPLHSMLTDLSAAVEQIVQQTMRANSQAYVIKPQDYEIAFMDMMAKTTRDPTNSISHHNREIMKSVLAQFLELGATDAGGSGGSRALSEDHSALFLQSLETVARKIASVVNKQAIKELVDLNFDGVKKYPELDFEGITSVDAKGIADAYQVLINTNAITAQDADEAYFRERIA